MNTIKNSKIVITGGAGFIGSTLVGSLVNDNNIIVYDNLNRNALASCTYASHKNLTVVQGDVLDTEHMSTHIKNADYVIHCAGIAGIDTVGKSPSRTLSVNIIGSHNVLESVRMHAPDIKRVVFFSTSEVFGNMAFTSCETDASIIGAAGHSRWTYAVSKLAEEHMALAWHKEFGIPCTVVRPFNIYGPGQVGEGALKIFIEQASRNEDITIYGDGTQIRAWCYVDDMVEGVLCCMNKSEALGESFNIGNNRSVQTIYGLANTVIRIIGSNSKVHFSPALSADISLRIPCVDKARNLLNFEAKIDLEEGIALTAEYYRRNLGV